MRHVLEGRRAEALQAARELIALQLRAIGQPPLPEAELERHSTGFLAQLESPWFQAFLRLDPREALRQLTVPVLVLNGELDLQVLPEQNLPEIEAALRAAGNERVTVVRFPGLNHLFQTARTGSTAEYAVIEETVAPVVLERVSAWLREVCAPE
ncbi:MAG: prolyl oligopeptidase family serine peptidase [Planctomycetota bacterium]